jgi:hypothetical protein
MADTIQVKQTYGGVTESVSSTGAAHHTADATMVLAADTMCNQLEVFNRGFRAL